jgi:hypothetical protein
MPSRQVDLAGVQGNERETTMGMGSVTLRHRRLRDFLRITSDPAWHDYVANHALDCCARALNGTGTDLGSILAICAAAPECQALGRLPFSKIILSGILDPTDTMASLIAGDPRMSYQKENAERISLPSASVDVVWCKSGLHHLARPVLGLYEMLRVCRKAVLVMEPYDSQLGRLLDVLGLSSVYEHSGHENIRHRDNFVFRWHKRQLRSLLNSYYLDSGYKCDIYLGWMSTRFLSRSRVVNKITAMLAWLIGWVPGAEGNMMTAIILPGTDIPPDPLPVEELARILPKLI